MDPATINLQSSEDNDEHVLRYLPGSSWRTVRTDDHQTLATGETLVAMFGQDLRLFVKNTFVNDTESAASILTNKDIILALHDCDALVQYLPQGSLGVLGPAQVKKVKDPHEISVMLYEDYVKHMFAARGNHLGYAMAIYERVPDTPLLYAPIECSDGPREATRSLKNASSDG